MSNFDIHTNDKIIDDHLLNIKGFYKIKYYRKNFIFYCYIRISIFIIRINQCRYIVLLDMAIKIEIYTYELMFFLFQID